MKLDLVNLLRCPKTGQRLFLSDNTQTNIKSSNLFSQDRQHQYPILRGIPRFVPQSNYADNFGMQWNQFSKTQLDSYSGHPISAQRFWQATGWNPDDLRDKWVLDVGCGSGRFAEIALNAGAKVVALDYSSAVDACYANLNHYPNLHVVQGDIYALPFAPQSFDFVYSLGVLQHTPDVERAFSSLIPMAAGGGRICVDYYEKSFKTWLLPKTWLRPITKRMDKQRLLSLVKAVVPVLLPISRSLGRIPTIGKLLKRIVPVANYDGIYPLSETQLREWAILDTFDWLSPMYDNPQRKATVQQWMQESGLVNVEVLKAGHLVGRASKL